MKNTMIAACLLILNVLWANELRPHPGLFCRILKISREKSIILLNLGREDNLKKDDYALLEYHGEKVARIRVRQISATRSQWEVFEQITPDRLASQNVFHLKFISANTYSADHGDLPSSEIKGDFKIPLPFPYGGRSKILLGFETGSRYRTDYDYPTRVDEGNHGQRFEFSAAWVYKSEFDHRFYFGPSVRLLSQSNKFSLLNEVDINEKRTRAGAGPFFQVMLWGNNDQSLSAMANFLIYYDQIEITQTTLNIQEQKAPFSGLSFGHVIGLTWQKNHFIGHNHLSLGLSAITDYPHSLRSKEILDPNIFPENFINNKTHTNFMLRFGLHIPLRI